MNEEQETIRKYLLGLLHDEDLQVIDLRIIEDEDFANELRFAESELVEDFLEGKLSGDELKLFNTNFLISEKREDLVRETVALKNAVARIRRSIDLGAGPAKITGKSTFGFWRPFLGFAAVAAILLVVVLLWRLPRDANQSPLEVEYSKLNSREMADTSQFAPESTFNLISDNLRDSSSPISKNESQLTSDVLFRLALPSGESSERLYAIAIVRASKTVFRQKDLRSYQNQGGRDLRVIIPRSVFEIGQYQMKVTVGGDKTEVATYNFGIS